VKKRVGIEMASPLGWERYVGDEGKVIGINTFGASGNGDKLIEAFGFTVENVVEKVKSILD
jgi:transketolase